MPHGPYPIKILDALLLLFIANPGHRRQDVVLRRQDYHGCMRPPARFPLIYFSARTDAGNADFFPYPIFNQLYPPLFHSTLPPVILAPPTPPTQISINSTTVGWGIADRHAVLLPM